MEVLLEDNFAIEENILELQEYILQASLTLANLGVRNTVHKEPKLEKAKFRPQDNNSERGRGQQDRQLNTKPQLSLLLLIYSPNLIYSHFLTIDNDKLSYLKYSDTRVDSAIIMDSPPKPITNLAKIIK